MYNSRRPCVEVPRPPASSLECEGRFRSNATASQGVAATAGSLGRETEDLRLANLAARVAAAARRVAHGQSLDPQRDRRVLVDVEQILRTGASALQGDPSKLPDYHATVPTSYAFARLTNSVLNAPPRRADEHDEPAARRVAAQTLLKLAGNIDTMLAAGNDPSVIPVAQDVEKTFNRISANVLSALGRPGDTLTGADYRASSVIR